jgi:hypothetical protein
MYLFTAKAQRTQRFNYFKKKTSLRPSRLCGWLNFQCFLRAKTSSGIQPMNIKWLSRDTPYLLVGFIANKKIYRIEVAPLIEYRHRHSAWKNGCDTLTVMVLHEIERN